MDNFDYDRLCEYLDWYYRDFSPGEMERYDRWRKLNIKDE